MGKNKKNNNVFKVAGAKSLKLKKAKAKVVKTELKNINIINKNKTQEVDKLLNELQDKVRNSAPEQKKAGPKKTSKLPNKTENCVETQKKSKEALDSLNKMQVN